MGHGGLSCLIPHPSCLMRLMPHCSCLTSTPAGPVECLQHRSSDIRLNMRRMFRRLIPFVLVLAAISTAAAPRTTDSAEIQLALKKLTVLGSALHVGAHPDDENTALIAWLANDRLYRAAYLSVTRGDGGQNLLGDEKGDLL